MPGTFLEHPHLLLIWLLEFIIQVISTPPRRLSGIFTLFQCLPSIEWSSLGAGDSSTWVGLAEWKLAVHILCRQHMLSALLEIMVLPDSCGSLCPPFPTHHSPFPAVLIFTLEGFPSCLAFHSYLGKQAPGGFSSARAAGCQEEEREPKEGKEE